MSFETCQVLTSVHLAADQRVMNHVIRVAMTLPRSVQHLKIEINDQEESFEDFGSLADWKALAPQRQDLIRSQCR